jgi:hypothetical protein
VGRGAFLIARVLVAGVVLAGCIDIASEHRCRNDADCVQADEMGRCEATRYCSFADDTCGTGNRRYNSYAGSRADQCLIETEQASSIAGLELTADTTQTSCGASASKDLVIDVNSAIEQVVFVDTAAMVALAVRAGACPGTNELACTTMPCGDAAYGRIAVALQPGAYCLVIEQALASSANELALRVFPAGRLALVSVGDPIAATTCGEPMQSQPACTSEAGTEALLVFGTCPGTTTVMAAVDPDDTDGLDIALSLRSGSATGNEVRCVNDAVGAAPETLDLMIVDAGPHWLAIDRASGADCGRFDATVTPSM